MDHPLIPQIGSVPPAERAFRVAWVDALVRGEHGEPVQQSNFVAQHCRVLHIIDVRSRDELTGPMGTIPGAFCIEPDRLLEACATLDPFDPIVLIDGKNERAPALALALERAGHRLVAFAWGGVAGWRAHGFAVTRKPSESAFRLTRIEPSFTATRRKLTEKDVREHLGDPRSTQRQKLASLLTHGHLSCVDGRDHGALLGTPGGDGGELLLAMSALERVTGHRFTDAEIARLLLARLDAFGPCAMHTDIAAANRTIDAVRAHPKLARFVEGVEDTLAWRAFWKRPPKEAREELLDLIVLPEHIGCGHLKLSLTRAEAYGTRRELVDGFLRAFFRARWNGSEETQFQPLPGGHAEGAVFRVRVRENVGPFTFVPLVSPMCAGTQSFVAHPEVAVALRNLFGRLCVETNFLHAKDLDRLSSEVDALGAEQLSQTLAALAGGLPIYDLWFDTTGCVQVEPAGEVPG